mgnify:CR=1 FL=1
MENKELDQLINDAMAKEKALQVRSEELALQSKEFADYLKEKKHNDDELEVLWSMCKQYMEENNITEHETDFIKLKLVSLGKYKAEDIDSVPDELCKITKSLDNKKVKAYTELMGKLPEGVVSMGNRLVKEVK